MTSRICAFDPSVYQAVVSHDRPKTAFQGMSQAWTAGTPHSGVSQAVLQGHELLALVAHQIRKTPQGVILGL